MTAQGFITRRNPANSRAIPGALFHYLAKGADTNGAHALIEIYVQAGNEPPAHTHQHEDESYFLLNGEMQFTIGDLVVHAKPGDYVFLPKGIPHQFKVLTPAAHTLMWLSPAGLDEWFWDNSVPAPDMQPLPLPQGPPLPEVIEHFVASLAEYGVTMEEASVLQD